MHDFTRLLLKVIGNPVMPPNRPPFAGAPIPGSEACSLSPLARDLVRRAQWEDIDPSAIASAIDAGWDAFALDANQKTLLGAYAIRAMDAQGDGIDVDWTAIVVAVAHSLRGDVKTMEAKVREIVGIPGPPTGDDPEKWLAPIGSLVIKIRELSAEMKTRLQAVISSNAAAVPRRDGPAQAAPPWGWTAATTGRPPEAPAQPSPPDPGGQGKPCLALTGPDPLKQTLEKLKGSSSAKNLVRFLARQANQEATLRDTARDRNQGRREPTRKDIESTKQQVRRTAANLEVRDAPLRIEYCWIQGRVRLVDRKGNRPALHINESADVAK
jgi:hypothetical protein